MSEALLYPDLLVAYYVVAGLTWAALTFVVAPYGRHTRAGWGPTIPARAGWIVMESPAVWAFAGFFALGRHSDEGVPLVMFCLWMLHYVHRAFVFPLRMRADGKRMPLLIAVLAVVFNVFNAYVNARWIGEMHPYPEDWKTRLPFVAGTALFLTGWFANLHSDEVLLRLRAPGETGYKVPMKGLHRLVAAPNYLGEIVEWIGWAFLTMSPAGLGFAIYTIANLAPRARAHLAWYRERFPEYPKGRKALVPGVW